jgi:dUTP pyrophosphatase
MQKIKFCFTSEKAKELYNGKPPQYETPFASGFDLMAVEFDVSNMKDCVIPKTTLIDKIFSWNKYYIKSKTKPNRGYLENANYTPNDCTIYPKGRILIKTGIRIAMPIMENEIMHLEICSRSGLSLKNGVFVLNAPGIVDNDYRGELGVILYNAGHEPYEIKIGDRIAQGIFNSLKQVDFQEISQEEFEATCCDTKRGSGGFGSTGK